MKYRLYIDEVGNSDLGASKDPNHRYLSLTGVIIELDYVKEVLHPTLEALKTRYFDAHPDEYIILHRKELLHGKPPFGALKAPDVRKRFNKELLKLLSDFEYSAITVVIDKLEHKRRYVKWRFDPYHYCMAVLVERYARWLLRSDEVGDVMAESRGGKEDLRLKKSFDSLCQDGTDHMEAEIFKKALTSKSLKVKPKQLNIAGLQVADLLAHPSYRGMRLKKERAEMPDDFGAKIYELLIQNKYQRRSDGRIDGWGQKWLP